MRDGTSRVAGFLGAIDGFAVARADEQPTVGSAVMKIGAPLVEVTLADEPQVPAARWAAVAVTGDVNDADCSKAAAADTSAGHESLAAAATDSRRQRRAVKRDASIMGRGYLVWPVGRGRLGGHAFASGEISLC